MVIVCKRGYAKIFRMIKTKTGVMLRLGGCKRGKKFDVKEVKKIVG